MTTVDIIHAFTHNPPGVFPKKALQAAMAQPDEVSPRLIEILQKGADDITALADTRDDNGFLYGMFLLAQFKEAAGLQPLIDFFSTGGMTAIMLTGDVVTENLNKLFAAMAEQDRTPLLKLIEDQNQNSFVRAAAIESLLCLVAWDIVDLAEVELYFLDLLTKKLEREPSHVWNYLADAASRIGSNKLQKALKNAYEQQLASDTYVPWDTAKELLNRSHEENMADLRNDAGLAPINNVIAEMENWACFTPVAERIAPIKIPRQQAVTTTPAKTGRNAPCPCGSGKKYKKCCQ